MPETKGTSKKPAAKKDFMDFIKDAAKDESMVNEFLLTLISESANEKSLCKLLHDRGYKGVTVKDCATLLHAAAPGGVWRSEMRKDY
jgi:hypothetical protein